MTEFELKLERLKIEIEKEKLRLMAQQNYLIAYLFARAKHQFNKVYYFPEDLIEESKMSTCSYDDEYWDNLDKNYNNKKKED